MQKILIILNNSPYDGSDITWNALRLADTLNKEGAVVRLFLMNDAVDLARESNKKPDSCDFDLSAMLKELIQKAVEVKVCGTCMSRCGLYKDEPYFEGAEKSTMKFLAEWVLSSDKVLTF